MQQLENKLEVILNNFPLNSEIPKDSYLIEILHKVQDEFAFIPQKSIPFIAKSLNLTKAEVYGVVSFYDDFELESKEIKNAKDHQKETLYLCGAEACQSMGSVKLAAQIKKQVADKLNIKTIYCLGNCALAPAAMLNKNFIGRLSTKKIKKILNKYK